MMVGNVYTKFYIVSTLRLSENKMKMMADNVYTKFYSVDTNGCSRTLNVNKLNDGWQCVHQVLYSVDTNGKGPRTVLMKDCP